jgi:trans-4-hydroxy-L-proline dehydratase
MKHKSIRIGDGELIVGEGGPAPKAAPAYPEICIHTRFRKHVFTLTSRESDLYFSRQLGSKHIKISSMKPRIL